MSTSATLNPGVRDDRARYAAVAALVAVALVWGGSFVVVKDTVAEVAPARLVGLRFAVATLVLLALRPRVLCGLGRRTLATGAVLGALLAGGFVLATVGLQTTSVAVSAFVIGTTVAFVPLVGWVWLQRRLSRRTAAAVALATAGMALITVRGLAVGPGVGLVVAAAFVFAVHLVALERWSRPGELYRLAVVQLATAAVLAFALELPLPAGPELGEVPSGAAWLGLLGLGGIATAGAFVALSWAQTRVDATTAAVILTLEPVTGAIFGMVRGETLGIAFALGAAAVLVAAALVARAR